MNVFKSQPLYFDDIADDKVIDSMYQKPYETVSAEEVEAMPKKKKTISDWPHCDKCYGGGLCTINMSVFVEVKYVDDVYENTDTSYLEYCKICDRGWYQVKLPPGHHDLSKSISYHGGVLEERIVMQEDIPESRVIYVVFTPQPSYTSPHTLPPTPERKKMARDCWCTIQ